MMKEKYDIKLIDPEDINVAIELVRSSFEKTYLIPSIYRAKGIEEFILSEINNPFSQYRYFVINLNGEIAGFAEYKVFQNTKTVFLNIIAINNTFKNKGIGNKIFKHTKDFFYKEGFQNLQLDVYNTNTVAMNWYKSFGFIKINSNFLYKITKSQNLKEDTNIFVKNFVQYKIVNSVLGFYFLDTIVDDKTISIGCIDGDLFLRQKYTKHFHEKLSVLSKKMNFKNMFYIGEKVDFNELEFIDEINRLELKLNHD